MRRRLHAPMRRLDVIPEPGVGVSWRGNAPYPSSIDLRDNALTGLGHGDELLCLQDRMDKCSKIHGATVIDKWPTPPQT